MSNKQSNNQTINKSIEKSNLLDLSFISKTEKYSVEFFNIEKLVTADFVKELRNKLNMSQVFFSKVLGVSNKTIEKWEQGKNPISGTAARLLFSISLNPDLLNDYFCEKKVTASNDEAIQKIYTVSNFNLFIAEENSKKEIEQNETFDDKKTMKLIEGV